MFILFRDWTLLNKRLTVRWHFSRECGRPKVLTWLWLSRIRSTRKYPLSFLTFLCTYRSHYFLSLVRLDQLGYGKLKLFMGQLNKPKKSTLWFQGPRPRFGLKPTKSCFQSHKVIKITQNKETHIYLFRTAVIYHRERLVYFTKCWQPPC